MVLKKKYNNPTCKYRVSNTNGWRKLKAMVSIGNKFKINYGYSDHTPELSGIAAVALGAKCIEKHLL